MEKRYSISDVQGDSNLNNDRQTKFRKQAKIVLKKGMVKGRIKFYYTKEQYKKLLITAGWKPVQKIVGGLGFAKRIIVFKN